MEFVYNQVKITADTVEDYEICLNVLKKINEKFLRHFNKVYCFKLGKKIIISGSKKTTAFDFFPAPIRWLDINHTVKDGKNITQVSLGTSIDNILLEFYIEYDANQGMAVSTGEITG